MGRRQKYGEPVYFSRAFHSRRSHWGCWQHAGKGRPGKKISLNKWLEWGGRQWYLPAAYSCGEGLVLDLCCQIPRADIQAFLDKWAPLAEREEPDGWPLARRMAVEKEDPLAFDLRLQVLVNGVALFNKRSSCRGWNPCLPETTSRQGAEPALLKRYGLSSASGWQLWRAAFPWRTKSRPRVNSLVVTLDQGPDALPGPCFSTGAPGAEFTFAHPATGVQHTLTVKAYEPQQLEGPGIDSTQMPTHYAVMTYTICPELPEGAMEAVDCGSSDPPQGQAGNGAAVVCIIGGADGPTQILKSGQGERKPHIACSALHYEQVEQVQWQTVFYQKELEKKQVVLL